MHTHITYISVQLTDFVPSSNKSPKNSAKSVKDGLLIGFIFQQSNIKLYLNKKYISRFKKYYNNLILEKINKYL